MFQSRKSFFVTLALLFSSLSSFAAPIQQGHYDPKVDGLCTLQVTQKTDESVIYTLEAKDCIKNGKIRVFKQVSGEHYEQLAQDYTWTDNDVQQCLVPRHRAAFCNQALYGHDGQFLVQAGDLLQIVTPLLVINENSFQTFPCKGRITRNGKFIHEALWRPTKGFDAAVDTLYFRQDK